MVIRRTDMKRKRKEGCSSPLLDDSPKRTKVHAQRKFAQGSNVNSPVITPVKELESERSPIDVLPEPVELLPIKRPNTEDFLTFLCFRGTPILPPSLNFFNTASIVDTNGQVHEIKSESPKNGPIDTSGIAKCGSSTEKPFIAFGVRKRADPIVISRQMDRKRRHALAIQALRRKYQEQKMAKIRALTISKLSEKVTNKTLVRTNSVSKTETVTKKSNTIQKTKVKVVATKHVKVTTQTLKTTLRPKIKQKMCLRSFRGRFVQKELQFRNSKKRPLPEKIIKKGNKKIELKKKIEMVSEDDDEEDEDESEYSSEDDEPLSTPPKETKVTRQSAPKIVKKASLPLRSAETGSRVTRSGHLINNKMSPRRQQMKKRILLTNPTTIVKPRSLRSTTLKKTVISQKNSNTLKIKQQQKVQIKSEKENDNHKITKPEKKEMGKTQTIDSLKKPILSTKKCVDVKKEINKSVEIKKEINKSEIKRDGKGSANKKEIYSSKDVKKEISKSVDLKKEIKTTDVKAKEEVNKSSIDSKKDVNVVIEKTKKETIKSSESLKKVVNKSVESTAKQSNRSSGRTNVKSTDDLVCDEEVEKLSKKTVKKEINKSTENVTKKEVIKKEVVKNQEVCIKKEAGTKKDMKKDVDSKPMQDVADTSKKIEQKEILVPRTPRPTRKTKEAAAIYMEILSHKLVHDSKVDDDDNISIDSFPELPNVKKTEQRENELKAQAKSSKEDVKDKSKSKDCDVKIGNEELSLVGIKESAKEISSKTIEKKKGMVSSEVVQKSENDEIVAVCEKEDKEIVAKAQKMDIATKSKNVKNIIKEDLDMKLNEPLKQPIVPKKSSSVGKRKSDNDNLIAVKDENEEVKKSKIRKCESKEDVIKAPKKSLEKTSKKVAEEKFVEPEISKRQTRNSQNLKFPVSDDSDESFHIDIKVPKRKKVTRSKAQQKNKLESEDEKLSESDAKSKSQAKTIKPSSSESDHSTTSDINLKALMNKTKNKKFSKTKSMKKVESSFSDSDEEPLSKLTLKSCEGSQKSSTVVEQDKKKLDDKLKEIEKLVSKSKVTIVKKSKPELEPEKTEIPKPKRECAKRPQNYLPMFSSSDEEDEYFHGFSAKTEIKVIKQIPLISEKPCIHVPPSSDLLSKDISRRFGKGKVNMSNEQIEKWLKDSAMAGSSVKNENDEMLKFGERIPTETSLDTTEAIDTQKLKSSLLSTSEVHINTKQESTLPDSTAVLVKEKHQLKLNIDAKPQVIDRKLIFRKDKKVVAPNVNAFSPENESSVYAFGEENEEVISTPFRRPSRRPSSTATSKSEDESSKQDESSIKFGHFRKPPVKLDQLKCKDDVEVQVEVEDNLPHFYIPQNPSKYTVSRKNDSPMVPPISVQNKTNMKTGRNFDRYSDLSEDAKYKVPSSPSASSSSSAKLYKRQTAKTRTFEFTAPTTVQDFPTKGSPGQLVEAPVFHPTDQEFQDPIEYIERIRHKAEPFGICKIVPPSSFKPECKVTDDMRFTAYNQYVHKMLHRWGPNFKELMAIKKYLETQNISLPHPPWIGGMEIDLPRLYQTVQMLGGLKEVIEKKKWPRVSEFMKIPKSAQDRVTKLDDIYCKYLLPYDTLSPAEREKLFDEVETDWAKRESKGLMKAQQKLSSENASEESESDDNEVEECIVKGRNMALNAFYRIARNTMSMHFKTSEPPAQEVEQEFWKHITLRQNHICVHSGSIDSGNWGYGFAVSKNSPFARHAWNLKVLTNNSGSVLRSMGPMMGVTVPTLHVGMVFSACCWYRDPHGLPWIEYLHTDGNKIWYGIPNSASDVFHAALKKIVPNYCRNKSLWLPSDTVMVPPSLLVENNVSLCRTVQEPGQFIVVFPKAFTSSISTGYVVSESVYFAPPYWLKTARTLFDDLKNSCEPSMFSLERLLLNISADVRSSVEVLRQIIPSVQEICDREKALRDKLKTFGSLETEKLPLPEAPNVRKRKKLQGDDGDYECEVCRMNLFISMVFDTEGDVTYCLNHAISMLEKKSVEVSNCKLMFTYDYNELDGLVSRIHSAIEAKFQKKIPNKYAGMPTLLTK